MVFIDITICKQTPWLCDPHLADITAAVKTTSLYTMAHVPPAEIEARRNAASLDIIEEWQAMQGQEWYGLQCPCRIDCGCMPEDEVPRIILANCMYPGELDYFFVTQPFQATYGFKVRWHCDECHSELACGEPNH